MWTKEEEQPLIMNLFIDMLGLPMYMTRMRVSGLRKMVSCVTPALRRPAATCQKRAKLQNN
jgi:hypothetical protein